LSGLLLALNQEPVSHPYIFKTTNLSVYSFEEALYHCYTHWKESADDFTSAEFADWVSGVLGHAHIGDEIKALADVAGFSERFTRFLRLTGYFADEHTANIKAELQIWESALEWERLKERADAFNAKGQAFKAYPLYKRALDFNENAVLLNNLSICLLKLQRFEEAYDYLQRAYEMEPGNIQILTNFTEAAIASHSFNKAVSLLDRLSKIKKGGSVDYLYGELNLEMGDIRAAASYFEKAAAETNEPQHIYRLCEIYVKLRMYDDALAVLDTVAAGGESKELLIKQAFVYVAAGNVPAAIKCTEKALMAHKADAQLWVNLAVYHRMDYDLTKASAAIATALNIDPYNERALLESARIKKSLGKTKDYQDVLKNILNSLKKKYRDPGTTK